jgi:glycosyltransferase involved in cell wall biosynthesis
MGQNTSVDMDTKPLVSVLMPVFNGEKYLAEAIWSILNQSFRDFEFIIIDDGSTDATWAILNSYTDQRLRLVQNVENLGHTKALNKGLVLAQGEYIARMDADDISRPERLARQLDFLETHPEIGVLGTWVQIMGRYGDTSHTIQFPTEHGVLRWCLCFYDPIVHPSVMMRREIVERVGGYNSDMRHAEDYDLWRRLSHMNRLSNLPEVLLYLRKHDANVSILHTAEDWRFGVQVSGLMISHILNDEVPASTVQRLWGEGIQTAYDVRPVAELVYRIYQAIASNDELSIVEKQTIRRDAAMRLYRLSLPWVKNVSVWGTLARACCLWNPIFVLRASKGRLRRVFNRQLRPSG